MRDGSWRRTNVGEAFTEGMPSVGEKKIIRVEGILFCARGEE